MANYDFYPVAPISKSSGSIRQRHFYDEAQLALLDAEFTRDSFPNRESRRRIALLIGVSEKSVMWWFQNRRRRVRQQGSGPAVAAQSYGTSRQQRRPWPYALSHRIQQDVLPQCLPSTGFYPVNQSFDKQPTNYWANESSTISPQFQSNNEVTNCTGYHQEVSPQTEMINYSSGYQPYDQQQPNYSFWNNWEYAPPFYPSSTNTADVYSEAQNPHNYSNTSCYTYYPSEYCNQVYM